MTKRFGGVAALAGCTVDVGPGTITGIIGPKSLEPSTAMVMALSRAIARNGSSSMKFRASLSTRSRTCSFRDPQEG